ncbi:phage tail spike protein [Streptococcus oralis]|uniref:phage tail spike protein n=1 Tax=Streptococcus oralis TaxID=1303 RepID=UPI002283708B|nr:phage tail spike protein [Streptococcus oralis]MCY7065156.1 phage tail protein [Streptococcus oralis]
MIYLTNGNTPLNAAYEDKIVQEDGSTYQLSFRFPTSDPLWEKLKEETFLTADDLHGEQDFVIFEVEKKHGYIQVYANQVFTLLNNYVVSSISLDRQTGSTALSRFAGAITRNNPFSFFSDIEDRHTFNIGSKNAMEAFAKDKHSIIGQWGGDLVRHGYQVRLLKNGGSENESLFMYKKNLSSYQHKSSTKSLKTRITFKTTVKGEGEKVPDRTFTVTIDSPLINKYSQIYEDVIEVNDQDVKDEASLRKYGEQYFKTSLCDMMEDSLELEVVGQSDVPVQMYDIVSLFHEVYNLDVRKKITKYTYSPMANKLLSIGFGKFKSGLSNMVSNAVSDAVKNEAQQLHDDFERQLERELKNADLAFDRKKEELVNQFTDGLNAAKARAEEVKRELSDTIDQRFSSFDNGPLQEAKRKAEEALRNAGASSLLAQEAKRISEQTRADITNLQVSSQNALSQIEAFKSQYGTKLNEVKNTADGLFTKMGAVETYISKDGQRQEALQRYARDESAKQVSAVREQISRDYVGKATYQEDVRGLERRFSAISTQTNNDIATKIAQYKQTVDGQFANITSQMAGKANQTDFQRVRETSQLYERILGNTNNSIADNVARMAMTSQLFQVEVGKYANVGGPNMLRNSRADDGLKYWTEANGRLGFTAHSFYFNGQKRMFELRPGAVVRSPRFIVKQNADYTLNFLGFDNNSKYLRVFFLKRKKGSTADYDVSQLVFNGSPQWTDGPILKSSETIKKSFQFNVGDFDDGYLQFEYERNNPNKWGGLFMTELDFYEGDNDRKWQPAPEDATLETDKTLEAVRTQMTLLQGSFAFQNLTSAGSIISQINAANNQILIEAEKIRLKGKTLLDELTAIQGYFKRLFVGDASVGTLNSDIIRSNSITADKLIMDQAMARLFVSSDIFTDTLAAKEAFINKLRSVVVSATLFEGFKGRIGGFQIGTHDKDPKTYWLTGQNQFYVGMSNGGGNWGKTALWVNWGTNWDSPGNHAWFVKESGEMYCYNKAYFWNTPVINGDLRVTGDIYYNNENSGKSGYWIYSSKYSNFEPSNNYLYLYYSGSGYDWIPMNKEISDRRYKHNIQDSQVSGLDVIENLKTYSYRKEYDGKIEDIACGIMAQDVQKYVPEAFYENPDGAYSYRTFELVPYLIKAIQELNQKIEKLEKTA